MASSAWIWSEQARLYYYYDPQRNEYVYQDGTRSSRSADRPVQSREVPRAFNAGVGAGRASTASLSLPTAVNTPMNVSAALGQPVYGGYSAVARDAGPRASSSAAAAAAAVAAAPLQGSLVRGLQGLSVGNAAQSNIITNMIQTSSGVVQDSLDRGSNVRTVVQIGPKKEITDPTLYNRGIEAYRSLQGTPEDSEQLDPRFKKHRSDFFSVGRVFLILWAEPASEANQTVVSSLEIRKGRFGEAIFHKVRRFVVIRQNSAFCTALPIMTYGGQGVAKANVKKSDHAMIYSGKQAPEPMSSELPRRGETGMRQNSIRVDPDDKDEKLDPKSRIDFGKPHTIHHNIKVRNFGTVNQRSMQSLLYQAQAVWMSDVRSHDQPRAGPAGANTDEHLMAELVKRGYSRKQAQAILEKRSRDLKTNARKAAAEGSDDEDSDDSDHSEESSDDERK